MAEVFNKENLVNDILAQLGNETVPVEIGELAQDAGCRRALEQLAKFKPITRHEAYITPVSGVYVHDCLPEVKGISDISVTITNAKSITAGFAIESQMLAGAPVYYGVGDTFYDIQYFDLRLRWLKQVSRELSSDPDYAYVTDPVTGNISIYTFATQTLYVDAVAVLEYAQDFTNVPLHNRKWLADWVKSEFMLSVGRVRGKFVSIPVAGGQSQLDGPSLIKEAKDMQAALLEQIQSSRADLFCRWA